MNMLRFDQNESVPSTQTYIAQTVFDVEAVDADHTEEKQDKAKAMLDRLFPLAQGSHTEVSSYLIDYHHVLAFFKDGTHSGLATPKQFVAYTGQRDKPASILLQDDSGSHAEIVMGSHKGTGHIELMTIDDILLETRTTFSGSVAEDLDMCGSQASVSTQRQQETSALRHWISLVKRGASGQPLAYSEDREFTGRDGEDYILHYCYLPK
ncbi:hypothetical protein HGP28_04005 [Vibrio sp. SM6]|uniref:Malate synthase G alpha-beta insertion domain-containing protein n=1 Tax=Vibrio agarilyticus TaxID=2726741 RepID=A0A7X8YG55_9VIBR|nr:hypothetical protein [Vibrio agarilyticus]NLS12056.1 hypothetical protein [Vibrio agarilyticus]